jgi:hypothetical protein
VGKKDHHCEKYFLSMQVAKEQIKIFLIISIKGIIIEKVISDFPV